MAGYININFPFKDSQKGFFLDLNNEDNHAIKADLLHLLLTKRGQRLYMPDFGTDLLQFIFEPEDGLTFNNIKEEIKTVVKKYIPNLIVNDIIVERHETNEYAATIRIDYTVTEGAFESREVITINV